MDAAFSYNVVLCFVIIVFWGAAMILARANRREISLQLMILPAFFVIAGITLNSYRLPWGTYIISAIHVIMLPALMKVAKQKL